MNWLKNNKMATTSILVVILFAGVALTVQGCDLQKMVKLDVPKDVSSALDTDEQSTLADAPMLWEDWTVYVEKNSKRLSSSIKEAESRYSLISSITEMGIGIASDHASVLPGGTFIVSGLSLMAGLFMKRPGDDKKVGKEKEKSFNAGLKQAVNLAMGKSDEN